MYVKLGIVMKIFGNKNKVISVSCNKIFWFANYLNAIECCCVTQTCAQISYCVNSLLCQSKLQHATDELKVSSQMYSL